MPSPLWYNDMRFCNYHSTMICDHHNLWYNNKGLLWPCAFKKRITSSSKLCLSFPSQSCLLSFLYNLYIPHYLIHRIFGFTCRSSVFVSYKVFCINYCITFDEGLLFSVFPFSVWFLWVPSFVHCGLIFLQVATMESQSHPPKQSRIYPT